MTFNQWAASAISDLPTPCRAAFEAVWDAMIDRGVSPGDARFLLNDLVESLPQPERCYDDEEY